MFYIKIDILQMFASFKGKHHVLDQKYHSQSMKDFSSKHNALKCILKRNCV